MVVLQHPHEARHKLSTLPVLTRCLANCHVLQGRSFQAGSSPLLDFFTSDRNDGNHHALVLFPADSAQPISGWFAHHQQQQSDGCQFYQVGSSDSATHFGNTLECTAKDSDSEYLHTSCQIGEVGTSEYIAKDSDSHPQQMGTSNYAAKESDSPPQQMGTSNYVAEDSDSHPLQVCISNSATHMGNRLEYEAKDSDSDSPHLVLIAIDATWHHANEMIKASAPFLSKFAVPVCLPFDADQEGFGMGNSDLILRKEPFKGCMTTLEAIASCLRVLEPNGAEIYHKLLSVLKSMVQFQASNISTHKRRMRQPKKSCNIHPTPMQSVPQYTGGC